MPITAAQVLEAAARWGLNDTVRPAAEKLATYASILLQWNTRLSLTAIRNEAELIERHLLEGVFAAAHHPQALSALDFGSGTGIPGVPIGLCRQDIHVTLAESQRKKASFLQEAVRQLELKSRVHAGRAEHLRGGSFDAVWMRAVDKKEAMLPLAAKLVAPRGSLCLLGTTAPPSVISDEGWEWKSYPLTRSNTRVLHIGIRA